MRIKNIILFIVILFIAIVLAHYWVKLVGAMTIPQTTKFVLVGLGGWTTGYYLVKLCNYISDE